MKKLLWLIGLIIVGVLGYSIYFLNAAMPTATGYSAKYVCSQVFLANRDPVVVFENDVKPTHPLFNTVKIDVDRKNKTVTARGFGFWSPLTAVYREGCGCTLAIDTSREELLNQAKGIIPRKKENPDRYWPVGEAGDFGEIPAEVNQKKKTISTANPADRL